MNILTTGAGEIKGIGPTHQEASGIESFEVSGALLLYAQIILFKSVGLVGVPWADGSWTIFSLCK